MKLEGLARLRQELSLYTESVPVPGCYTIEPTRGGASNPTLPDLSRSIALVLRVELATPNLGIAIDWLWSTVFQDFDGAATRTETSGSVKVAAYDLPLRLLHILY